MAATHSNHPPAGHMPVLAGWVPISSLWDGPAALFPSEQSARWALRGELKNRLVDAGALARLRGRLFIQPERAALTIENKAIDDARRLVAARAAA
jgi:hypothetical protein